MSKIFLLFSILIPFFCVSQMYSVDMAQFELGRVLKDKNVTVTEIELTDSLKQQANFVGSYFKVICNSTIQYAYFGRVNCCRTGGCERKMPKNAANTDSYEFLEYLIVFTSAKHVQLVKVLNYEATHGQEVTASGWLRQFVGYKGNKILEVGVDVDAISGATISVYAITADIQQKTMMLQNIDF